MNPYPFLYRIDGRHIPGVPKSFAARMLRDCRRVQRSTGRVGYYHLIRGTVMFLLGPDLDRGGPVEDVVFDAGRWLPINVDQVIRRIQRAAKTPMRVKKRRVQDQEKEHAHARARYAQTVGVDAGPEFRSIARYLLRKNESRHSRPSILVP